MSVPIIAGTTGRRTLDITAFRDISGGTRIKFGKEEIILSPHDTIQFATNLLKAVGVDVKFDESMFRADA